MWKNYKIIYKDNNKLEIINTPCLITAEILYYFPDYPSLLQTYIWQCNDNLPEYPRLNYFLNFWEKEIEGKLHSVTVSTNTWQNCHEYKFIDHQSLI